MEPWGGTLVIRVAPRLGAVPYGRPQRALVPSRADRGARGTTMVHSPMMNRSVEGRTPKSPPWGMAKLEGAKLVLGPAHSLLQAPRTGRCPPLPCHPNSSRLPIPALYPTLCSPQHPVQAFQGSCQMVACHLYPPLPSLFLSCSVGLCPEVPHSHHSAPSPPSSLCSHTRSSKTQFKMTAHFCHNKPPITCNCGSSASLAILPQATPAIFTLHFVMSPPTTRMVVS